MAITRNRILAITTGGTIASIPSASGLKPDAKRNVVDLVRKPLKHMNIEVEVEPIQPIDSTNMLTEHRADIARIIYRNVHEFDGFVITHGTDTMVDTAAALTFMLQDVGKPIVLTGSQISAYEYRTDGINNMLAAFNVATQDYGEVVIAFGNHTLRGPRAIKFDEQGFNAFQTPRCPPIGKIGIRITPTEHRIRRFVGEPRIFTGFDTDVGFFYPMSGISPQRFVDMAADEKTHGIIMVGFGAGNIPDVYHPGIEMATTLHKPTVILTQCLEGGSEMAYEVGVIPLNMGAISGRDMTMQATTQKLMYALGKANLEGVSDAARISFVKRIMHTVYANELDPEF